MKIKILTDNWFKLGILILIGVALYIVYSHLQRTSNLAVQKAEQKLEQDEKEYFAKRSGECYRIYEKEREEFNNVTGQFYNEIEDECIITYSTDKYEGVDCKKEYGDDLSSLYLECRFGQFTKRF